MPETNTENHIPLSGGFTHRIRSEVNLPLKVGEGLLLNAPYVHSLLQLSGFRHLSIVNDVSGETSKENHSIVGIFGDGSAAAGKVSSTTVPVSRFSVGGQDQYVKQCSWPDLKIKVNTKEIQQRILNRNQRVWDLDPWRAEFDKSLRNNLLDAGTRQLLWGGQKWEKSLGTFFLVQDILLSSLSTPDLIHNLMFTGIFFTIVYTLTHGGENEGYGRRVSLFTYCFEPDRALLLQIHGRRHHVVTHNDAK